MTSSTLLGMSRTTRGDRWRHWTGVLFRRRVFYDPAPGGRYRQLAERPEGSHSPRALGDIDSDSRRINATLTKAQVEKSPDIDTDRPVSHQQVTEYYRYYEYPSYWSRPYLWGGYPFLVMSPGRATTLEHERHWERGR